MSNVAFLLWSGKHQSWWKPGDRGYTPDIELAGRYSEAEATKRVVRSATCGDRTQVTSMVAAPDNWTDTLTGLAKVADGEH